MKIKNFNSLEDIPQQELLRYIFINQIHILQKIETIENEILKLENPDREVPDPQGSVDNSLRKLKSFNDRINDSLRGHEQ